LDEGYASRYTDQRILTHYDSSLNDVYLKTTEEVHSGVYDLLFPLTDETFDMVTRHKQDYERYVKMPVPDRQVFERAFDKQNTMDICMDNDIPIVVFDFFDGDALERVVKGEAVGTVVS
jgi:uridylate kinase